MFSFNAYKIVVVLGVMLPMWSVRAGEQEVSAFLIPVCYNYGCSTQEWVELPHELLDDVRRLMAPARDAAHERQLLSLGLAHLYHYLAMVTPIGADRGGNTADDEGDGRMDCIDHAQTTRHLLELLDWQGLLAHHRVLPVVRRSEALILDHYSAAIRESGPSLAWESSGATDEGSDAPRKMDDRAVFVIDSWFRPPGRPVTILDWPTWDAGAGEEERVRLEDF